MWLQQRQQSHKAAADEDLENWQALGWEHRRPRTWRLCLSLPLIIRMPLLLVIVFVFLAFIGHLAQPNAKVFNATTGDTTAETTPEYVVPVESVASLEVIEASESEPTQHKTHKSRCQERKEWRTLTRVEQREYIDATLCLRTLFPSNKDLDNEYSGYDDFPWIDAHHGYATHGVASFLPWHRQFLHLYENTLRRRCAYKGTLVYWDWTLDYEDFTRSPVFDPITGFGGDGQLNGDLTVGQTGRCVIDGPYAGTRAAFWNGEVSSHCLSRGFRNLYSNHIRPESIEEMLNATTFEKFVSQMEARARDTVPLAIGGEFEASTASYDPLFFLHFTQLDRLWWLWQQRQSKTGRSGYGGRKVQDSFEAASLDDELFFGGLGKTVKVKDVINTETKKRCYRY